MKNTAMIFALKQCKLEFVRTLTPTDSCKLLPSNVWNRSQIAAPPHPVKPCLMFIHPLPPPLTDKASEPFVRTILEGAAVEDRGDVRQDRVRNLHKSHLALLNQGSLINASFYRYRKFPGGKHTWRRKWLLLLCPLPRHCNIQEIASYGDCDRHRYWSYSRKKKRSSWYFQLVFAGNRLSGIWMLRHRRNPNINRKII